MLTDVGNGFRLVQIGLAPMVNTASYEYSGHHLNVGHGDITYVYDV